MPSPSGSTRKETDSMSPAACTRLLPAQAMAKPLKRLVICPCAPLVLTGLDIWIARRPATALESSAASSVDQREIESGLLGLL